MAAAKGNLIALLALMASSCLSLRYNGTADSWASYAKWDMCPHQPASLDLQFQSNQPNGLLAFMDVQNSPEDYDYMLLQIRDNNVVLEYRFGGQGPPARFNASKKISGEHAMTITRNRMILKLELDSDDTSLQQPDFGADLCFGDCLNGLRYTLNSGVSDLYLGGVPSEVRNRASSNGVALPGSLDGEIFDVYYQNCQCQRTNPQNLELGADMTANAENDPCFGKDQTSPDSPNCVCYRHTIAGTDTCPCTLHCDMECNTSPVIEYNLGFSHQANYYIKNNYGLDARMFRRQEISTTPIQHIKLGNGAYMQMAGDSQRDECLGNLDLCPDGYTLALWMVMYNDDLTMQNGVLLDNGGMNSHGVAVYWENGELVTRFRKSNGDTWTARTRELYLSKIYHEGHTNPDDPFVDYWYNFAASWSQTRGLKVYLNGQLVAEAFSPTQESMSNPNSRQPFFIGSESSSPSNLMGVAEIRFASEYRTQEEIISTYLDSSLGPLHYYMPMNAANGRMLVAYPPNLNAEILGTPQFVEGRADQALRLGNTQAGVSYIDAGNVSHTCFGNVRSCDMYVSFWVRFDEFSDGMTLLDTGKHGITIRYQEGQLQALIYSQTDDARRNNNYRNMPVKLAVGNIQPNKWYFVEVDREQADSSEPHQLYINGQRVDTAGVPPLRPDLTLIHTGGNEQDLLIGKKNGESADSISGSFTIDHLELLQGNRDLLRGIGHIQRGTPPHAFFNMDSIQMSSDYRNIRRDPSAEIVEPQRGYQFVPGKDMNALSLSGSTFEITQPLRSQECYNNIERCQHGILVRGWFNLEQLVNNAGIMSTGLRGLDMSYRNGRVEVKATTSAKKWTAALDDIEARKWHYLEMSFHPKSGLAVYSDYKKVAEDYNPSDMSLPPSGSTNNFVVGRTNDREQQRVAMIVDDFEIWYGDRDYVYSLHPPCYRNERYVISFDGRDQYRANYLNNRELSVRFLGNIEEGLYDNSLSLNGASGQMAWVEEFIAGPKSGTSLVDDCFGNLALCNSGFTVWFYIKPESGSLLDSSLSTYLLSTGTNGIDIFYKDSRLHAVARAGNRKWEVASPENYLVENQWNTIIVAWSPFKGLIIAKDDRMYRVAQDVLGQQMDNMMDSEMTSQFLIGGANSGVGANNYARGLNAAFDDMMLIDCYLPPNLGPIAHESFSFERNHLRINKVEHPRFEVSLFNGAGIVTANVGNATVMNGNNQYADLGRHTDTCIDNLDLCETGRTLTFRLNPKGGAYQENQVVMSGSSYDISLVELESSSRRVKLQVKVMDRNTEWVAKTYGIPFDEWTKVDVSWTQDGGLIVYTNNTAPTTGSVSSRTTGSLVGNSLLVGKANNHANRNYFNGMIDEINFYQTSRRELVKKGIILSNECDIPGLVVKMDAINGNRVVHAIKNDIIIHNGPVRLVDGLIDKGIELADRQHVDVGSHLSCQSRPSDCANGFTMRFSIKPKTLNRNSYLIASNPAEVVFASDGNLHVRYRSVTGLWEGILAGLQLDEWYTIDLSWDHENGMTVYVNNEQRSWSQLTSETAVTNYDQSNHFMINRPSSPTISAYDQSEFVIDNLQIWDAKLELLQACDKITPAPMAPKHHAIYPSGGTGYIRVFYIPNEFQTNGYSDEDLKITFQTNRGNGLLWYNKDNDIVSYVYLKNGELWFATKNGNRPVVERQVTYNERLDDNKDHVFRMTSIEGNPLTFYLDDRQVLRFTGNHKVRFITEDFNIGGHKDPSGVTDNAVTTSFVGIIKDVVINSTGYDTEFNIFEKMWGEQFPDYVRTSCDMVFDPEIAFICDAGQQAVTFLKNDTYITIGEWGNQGTKPSLEVSFTTVEPRGLLLFAGRQNDDYFALEVFDNLLWMVTYVGDGPVRQQVSTGEVTDNKPHTAKFIFNADEGEIQTYFDGVRTPDRDIPLPARNRPSTLFADRIYLGGYKDYNMLPWHIWSEAGFIGCVELLEVNTIVSQLQTLFTEQRSPNIVNGCQPFRDYCSPNPCLNGGQCSNRKDGFYCDCTGLNYNNNQNEVCGSLALIANINGTSWHDINLGRNIKTHVNDISTKFKTLADEGTLWMTNSPTNPEYIKTFFENGILKVAVNAGGDYREIALRGIFNDDEWHTLNVKRRANQITVWVDDREPITDYLGGENYYIHMNTIRLGADAVPNPKRPYFLGMMRNLKYPPPVVGYPFNWTYIPILPPQHVITLRTRESYLQVPNTQDEMRADFKIIIMFKTRLKDSLILYQPGHVTRPDQYLAALLNDGKVHVRFNFGGNDELISFSRDVADDQWHMLEINRKNNQQIQASVDNGVPVVRQLPQRASEFTHSETMYIGGVWNDVELAEGLKAAYNGLGGYLGCLATLVKAKRLVDLTNPRYQSQEVRNSGAVVTGCVDTSICVENQCQHGCKCSTSGDFCDNEMIPYSGLFCENPDGGAKFFVNRVPGQVSFEDPIPISTTGDKISFGFITCKDTGTFVRISGTTGSEYISIYLEDGKVVAKYRLGGGEPAVIRTMNKYSDSKPYIVQFMRNGLQSDLKIIDTVSGELVDHRATAIPGGDNRLDGIRLLEIGSVKQGDEYVNPFDGVMYGFKHGTHNVFSRAQSNARGYRFKYPGTSLFQSSPEEQFECNIVTGKCGPDRPTCKNYGVCMDNLCNCTLTAYAGDYCDEEPEGHYYGWHRWESGLMVHEYPKPSTTYEDYFAIGLMTYEPNGTIFRVESADRSQFYDIRMVNGKAQLEYKLTDHWPAPITEERVTLNNYDKDEYHVIRMNRTGTNITFYVDDYQLSTSDSRIANIPFENQKFLISGGIMQDREIVDDWNGILAGLNYNSRFFYGLPLRPEGDVANAPHPFFLKKRPPRFCDRCYNGGVRVGYDFCDCTYTGWLGACCDSRDGLSGFFTKKSGGNSTLIYTNGTMATTRVDDLSVSFQTANGWGDGEIVRVVSENGRQYIILEIVDNRVRVRYDLCGNGTAERMQTFTDNIRDKGYYDMRLSRTGNTGYISLSGINKNTERGLTFASCEMFSPHAIYTGGHWDGTNVANGHYGIIWGLVYNGLNIVDIAKRGGSADGNIVVRTEGLDNFEIVNYPWPPLCDKGSGGAACDTVVPVPQPGGGAGAIVEIGGGVVPKPTAVTFRLVPVSTGAIIAAVMGGLLFSSAIAFAAVGMKPGFLALSKRFGAVGKAYVPVDSGKASAFPVSNGGNFAGTLGGVEEHTLHGAGGSQAGSRRSQYEESFTQESRFDGTDGMNGNAMMNGGGGGYNAYNTSSSWYTRNEMMQNEAAGYGAGSTIGGYGRGGGYPGSVAGGSVSGSVYGFGTVTNPDQAFITLSEDIAVDNVVLTADGRYVVTGSNLGPPQVWNTNNGEMVTTMQGDFMGSTGLHLAGNEKYLVGETMAEQAAVDMNDVQTGNHIPIRRVAVWDFCSGKPLPIAVDQLCTASCVSKDGFKVVMAMTDKFGGGTTVKVLDLLSNQVLHEITYPDTIGVADSASCVFISPDDRFVAVGFTNSFDNNANFIVFDLFNKSGVIDSPIVALNADPHCTVILNHDEALTGTRNGELVVWSMKTGKAQRQLTSGDATMLGHGGMPAAHDREVKEVALSDDGKYLASASVDRTVKVWNMSSESLLHTLHGHNDEVWTVDIASDNSIIVSGSQDGTIKLWRLRNGNQITSFNATMDIFHARFSKDKKTVVALGDKFGARKLIMLQIVSQKKWRMKSS